MTVARSGVDEFLRSTDVIDWQHPSVRAQAERLRGERTAVEDVARRCFKWVRDEIAHSTDAGTSVVTCTASDVLREGSGYCYAKSHLLAALLRANGIPAGLCYQRLSLDDDGRRFCLHGFNAVLLPAFGWYRVDARGNRPGIDARFSPPAERLAFPVRLPGEMTFPQISPDPLPVVIAALRAHTDAAVLGEHLPDLASVP
jgi:transglutaminase-like putative cysteine protease